MRPFHLILYSITQTKVKCELMYSIYHAFVARWDHSASSFSPTSPPSLSAPPSLPLFTVGRATSRASTRRGRGGRNNPPGNILSLFHVLPAYFSSRNLSLPFRSSSPLPFLFLLFFFFFFLPFPSARKALSTALHEEE